MEIVTKTDLNVSKEAAWKVLSDFAGWNSWNPALRDIVVDALEPGAKVAFKIKLARGPLGKPAVDAAMLWVRPGEGFAWVGPRSAMLKKVMSGEHWFLIEAIDDSSSVFHHGERFTGALAGALAAFGAKPKVEAIYAAFNMAFKAAVEG